MSHAYLTLKFKFAINIVNWFKDPEYLKNKQYNWFFIYHFLNNIRRKNLNLVFNFFYDNFLLVQMFNSSGQIELSYIFFQSGNWWFYVMLLVYATIPD